MKIIGKLKGYSGYLVTSNKRIYREPMKRKYHLVGYFPSVSRRGRQNGCYLLKDGETTFKWTSINTVIAECLEPVKPYELKIDEYEM